MFDDIYLKEPRRIISNKDLLPQFNKLKAPLSFKPGEKWGYSNINFNVLALLVEEVSGQQFEDFLQEHIFAKAKMTDTYLLEDYPHRRKDATRVTNHRLRHIYSETPIDANNESFQAFNVMTYRLSGLKGESKIVSTANDLLKFDQSLYGEVLLTQATLDEALTPTTLTNGKPAYTPLNLGKKRLRTGLVYFRRRIKRQNSVAHGRNSRRLKYILTKCN